MIKDLNKAAYYYNAAAEKGNAIAMHKIAYCYYFGQGVDWDPNKAKEWLKKEVERKKLHLIIFQVHGRMKKNLSEQLIDGMVLDKDKNRQATVRKPACLFLIIESQYCTMIVLYEH